MTYSYTQLSHYVTCPRRYRYRYLDGWKEKDTRAAMLFGRAFENALGAFFRHEDLAAALGSCPANSSMLSSKTCVRKHRDRLPCQMPRLRLSRTCYLLASRIEKLQMCAAV